MNVSFSSFQVVCYWGTWANYRPEGGDKTCFPNIFLSSALFYFGILFKVLPIFRKVHTGPRGRHPLHTSHLQVALHSLWLTHQETGSPMVYFFVFAFYLVHPWSVFLYLYFIWFTLGLFFVFVFYLAHLIPFAVLPALTLATGRWSLWTHGWTLRWGEIFSIIMLNYQE